MADSVTFDVRPTAGHAAATVSTLIGDGFMDPRPARRARYTAPLEMTALPKAPTSDPWLDLNAMMDEVFDEPVLVPLDLDWQVEMAEISEFRPQPERRLSRPERLRQDLGSRFEAVRASLQDVKLRVTMLDTGSEAV